MPHFRQYSDVDISNLYLENCLKSSEDEIDTAIQNFANIEKLRQLYTQRKQELEMI
jgi:hypothetical protein